jgi:hypothetical protein
MGGALAKENGRFMIDIPPKLAKGHGGDLAAAIGA